MQVDALWVVAAEQDQQVQRLIERNALSEHEAQERIEFQGCQGWLQESADELISNTESPEALESHVQALLADLIQ